MRKIAIGISSITVLFLIYYFTIGKQQAIDKLKVSVDRELKTLQKSGFTIEDRNISKDSEHFIIHYADGKKIAKYLNRKNTVICVEDSRELEGMSLSIDVHYLDGLYSAISVDIYPISLADDLIQSLSVADKKAIDKIIKEKIVQLHVDINKLFNSFRGRLKDIDTTIASSDESFTILSKGFEFGGDLDKNLLISSYQKIAKAEITSKSGLRLLIDSSDGSYKRGDDPYTYSSSYKVKSLVAELDKHIRFAIDDIDIQSTSKSKDKMLSASYDMKISKVDIIQPDGNYTLYGVDNIVSVENLSTKAIEKLNKVDKNDTKATAEAIKSLLSKDLSLKIDKLYVDKIKEPSHKEAIDGFQINASSNIIKPIDFVALKQNPFSIVDDIGAKVHIELSDKLYIVLQKRPEMMILAMILKPISKKDKMLFDLDYTSGSLLINGRPLL